MKSAIRAFCVVTSAAFLFFGAETYQKPPKAIEDILNSPATPTLSLSPNHAYALQGSPVRYPPIAELSEPMLRLAGIRINPKTNGLHNTTFQSNLLLRKIPEGTEIKIGLPVNPKLGLGPWTSDGSRFAFTNSTPAGIEVWIGEAATGRTHRVPNVHLNEVFGGGRGGAGGGRGGAGAGGGDLQWMPDGKSLLVFAVRANRGPAPPEPTVPAGPHISESMGGEKGAPTYEDLLQNPHDEDLFEYYATAQLAVVDSVSGAASPIGKPAMIESARMSPDGKYFIVNYIHRPFSYSYPARQFPTEIEIWDRTGKVLKKEASIPMGGTGRGAGAANAAADEETPISAGPRGLSWLITDPSTLTWFEGNGGRGGRGGRGRGGTPAGASAANTPPQPVHEKIMGLKPPFDGTGQAIYEADLPLEGFAFTENLHTAIIGAGGFGGRGGGGGGRGAARAQTAYLIDFANPKEAPKPLWTSGPSRYNNPGSPVEKPLPSGGRVIVLDGDNIFLQGTGPSTNGDHPFLSRYNLATKETKQLFKCDDDHYEAFEGLLDAHGDKFLTRRESPTEPPNYYVRTASGQLTAVTNFPDPRPIMRKVKKELVTYKRPDGVDMSFTLYLPPEYTPGKPLPTVLWAYPYEYETADVASETATNGSRMRFTEIASGYSEIFFALDGYAVLDNASMPIVGPRATVNDHFLDQLLMDAKAAVDKAVEMGVTDRNRVGVGGHSYGAYMTDNLLAHSDLFKAGIAESGAPNRTLTPFGFQSERRTLWDDPDLYIKMSPFMYANKIKSPLLLIHGEADDNTGTFPIQSERMYEAVRGNGGTVRLVLLPSEAHGYRAKETIEHVNWEKLHWFDKWVKDPPPPNLRGTTTKNNEKDNIQ
jgi:dipeptidyl aminopeptidase/acylaminoacyl peptidase